MVPAAAWVLIGSLGLAGCGWIGDPEDPVAQTSAFLWAVRSGRCDRAWSLLSRQTREQVERRAVFAIHGAPYSVRYFAPRRMFCTSSAFSSYLPRSVRLLEKDAGRASVSVLHREGTNFLIPGFFPLSYEDHPTEMRLVRDADGWRVDLYDTRDQTTEWREERVGEITVRYPVREGGWRREVWAEGPISASLEAVEEVFRDFSRWPEIDPFVREARAIGASAYDGFPHVWARLAPGPDREIAAFFVLRLASPVLAGEPSFGVMGTPILEERDPPNDPPLITLGDLSAAAYLDGENRARLQISAVWQSRTTSDPPPDLMPSAERMAAFFRAVDGAAHGR